MLDAPPGNEWATGLSSLNRRTAEMQLSFAQREVRVPACRLDSALRDVPGPIALWVDVEGAAGRVIDGLEGIVDRVSFMCIELETRPIWEGQLDASEVLNKLAAFGFCEVTRSEEWPEGDLGQVNVVLTRDIGERVLLPAKALAEAAQAASGTLSLARRARRAV